jgi:hypothetical protein
MFYTDEQLSIVLSAFAGDEMDYLEAYYEFGEEIGREWFWERTPTELLRQLEKDGLA